MPNLPLKTCDSGTAVGVDDESRYGELTDEYEQMRSAEAVVPEGSIIVCGPYFKSLAEEMVRYLITRN